MNELWEHQKKAIALSKDLPSLALFWEMGTGKTAATIHIIRHKCHQENRLLKVLILAPKAVLHNWRREFAQYSKIDQSNIVVLDQPGKKRLKIFREAVLDDSTQQLSIPRICITNYESAQMIDLIKAFHSWGPDILICDESHRLKNHQSKRAKQVIKLSEGIKWKYLLTGSPILNSPMDIFNQFLVLDGGDTFGKNFWAFRNSWFEDENAAWSSKPGHFPKYAPRPSTFRVFNQLIYKKAMRVIKSECLDLPPLVKKEVEVELSPEQARLYKQMKNEYIAFIDEEIKSGKPRAVVAQLAVTKALRLQQIVSGFAKTEDGEIHVIKENPRLQTLKDYLEQITPDHKCIVWATFQENYRAISEVCAQSGISYVSYHGLVPSNERENNLAMFRGDPACRVMIANQGAGGIGINMTEASYALYYSRDFSLEKDIQSEARNYRGGSEIHQKVTRIDLIAKDTIDELISEVLKKKQNVAEHILDWRSKL